MGLSSDPRSASWSAVDATLSGSASDMNSGKKRKVTKVSSNLHIHENLALRIMSKLPIKSAKRFTCIKKSWVNLFETPHFLNMYTQNFVSKTHLTYEKTSYLNYCWEDWTAFLLSGQRFENKVELDLPPQSEFEYDEPVAILGSGVDGIICLYEYHRGINIVLCNPATKEFKLLPLDLNLELTPYLIKPYGFGYDRVHDDYKVIRYLEPDFKSEWKYALATRPSMWQIYSLTSNSWRKLDVDMPRHTPGGSQNQMYVDGVCHWFGKRSDDDDCLVSFNLTTEKLFTTTLPFLDASETLKPCHRNLVVLSGCVGVIYFWQDIYISILGELGVEESWTKLFVITPSFDYACSAIVGEKGHIFFTSFHLDDDNEDDSEDDDWEENDGEFVVYSYDLSTQTFERLDAFEGDLNEMVIYKESLLSIGRAYD